MVQSLSQVPQVWMSSGETHPAAQRICPGAHPFDASDPVAASSPPSSVPVAPSGAPRASSPALPSLRPAVASFAVDSPEVDEKSPSSDVHPVTGAANPIATT
jgi:hypothetical protein